MVTAGFIEKVTTNGKTPSLTIRAIQMSESHISAVNYGRNNHYALNDIL